MLPHIVRVIFLNEVEDMTPCKVLDVLDDQEVDEDLRKESEFQEEK